MKLSFTWLIFAVLVAESYAIPAKPAPKPGTTKKSGGSPTGVTVPGKSSKATPPRTTSVPPKSTSTNKSSTAPASRTTSSVPPKSTSVASSSSVSARPSSSSRPVVSSSASGSLLVSTSASSSGRPPNSIAPSSGSSSMPVVSSSASGSLLVSTSASASGRLSSSIAPSSAVSAAVSPSSASGAASGSASGSASSTASPSGTLSSSSALPSASSNATSCKFLTRPRRRGHSAKFAALSARTIPLNLFHATCKNSARGIKKAIAAGTFALRDTRRWPDEFTWSGGFYLTPDEVKAHRFAAIFSSLRCQQAGGPVVIEFEFDAEGAGLQVVEIPDADAVKKRSDLGFLGEAIKADLRQQQQLPPDQLPGVPTAEQIDDMISRSVLTADKLQTYNDFKTADVIAGAAPMFEKNQKIMEAAQDNAEISPIRDPFKQVVLVTNKAMQTLKFVQRMDIEDCIADQAKLDTWVQWWNSQATKPGQT